MTPLTLEEFAQQLRVKGDWREGDFADEILMLLDIEEEVAEPYGNLCSDIEHYAKEFSNPDDAAKALEWIGDRSDMLKEIEEALDDAGIETKAPNGTPLDTLERIKQILAERPEPMEYDL